MTGDRSVWRRVGDAWRGGGAAAVVRSVLLRIGGVRQVLLLAAPASDLPADDNGSVTFEWVSRETFDREVATPAFQFPPAAARSARRWLDRGDRCLLGRVDARPATYLWVATSVREFPGAPCPIGPGTAYVYKTFTLPAFRGQGLNTAALREARRRCAMEGYRQVLIDVASNNTASRRAIERAGFVQVGRFLLLRLGTRRRAWMTASAIRRISGTGGTT